MKKNILLAIFLNFALCVFHISYAGILASSTRVIYNETAVEKSLLLVNTNEYPVLTQLWVDDGKSNTEFKNSPFVVLPAVFKLAPNEIKGVRILHNGLNLPKDRESMYWLNLYEIPAIKKESLEKDYLNLAMNTQMKIFFRPKSLKNIDIHDLQKKIEYKLINAENNYRLELHNPTPYYLNITSLKIKNNFSNSNLNNQNDNTIQPFSKNEYILENKDFKIFNSNQLSYNLIDDYGFHHSYTINID